MDEVRYRFKRSEQGLIRQSWNRHGRRIQDGADRDEADRDGANRDGAYVQGRSIQGRSFDAFIITIVDT